MRKIVVGAFLSLDGVMQAPGGPPEDPTGGFTLGGWSVNYWDDAMNAFMGDLFSMPYDLLLGRKTYEIFAAHWPYSDDPIGEAFNAINKYVATRTNPDVSWVNTVPLRGDDVIAQIQALKQTDGKALLTQGSTVLLQSLFEADLVDELRLMTFPLRLGKGKRLFQGTARPAGLKLISSSASGSGVVMSVYQRDGEIVPGTFELATPSPAELARRDRWSREG